MGKEFFKIATPRDLLEKARRDIEKMKADTSTDTIFNFFVTTYHVVDYIKALGTIPQTVIDQLYSDADFRLCQFLCNKGKHIQLRGDEPFEAKHKPAIPGGALDSFSLGVDQLGDPERFVVLDGAQEVDVIQLGNKLIKKWEDFFSVHGIL
jgi:hypothetical protein